MNKSNILRPKLRFPEFSGDWEEKLLDNIATFSKGKSISKNDIVENGEFECIRYGELYTEYGEIINKVKSKTNLSKEHLVFSQYNDVIIPASGETQIDIATASCVLKDGVALGGDLNIIRLKENGIFIAFYLNSKKKKDIASLAQGNSVVHLYSTQLKSLLLNIPRIDEQTKIANFLSAVDTKIHQLTQKKSLLEQYKKGVMQKIFTQEIRFKDDNGKDFADWEEKSLGDCLGYEQPTNYLVSSIEYDNKYKTPVVTAGKTFILGYTDEETGIYNIDLPVIIFDDFTTSSQFVDFPFKAKSSAMKILKANGGFNIKFIYEAMQMIKYEIGGHGRHWISIYSKLDVLIPSFEEQTKIANFLSAIDDQINQVAKQLEKTTTYKKGLLQQMFV